MTTSTLLAGTSTHRSRKRRKLVLSNSYIASIAEAEPGFDRYL
jgi:hypothetical protein